MALDTRDRSIIAQVAAKAAAEIVAGKGGSYDDFASWSETINNNILSRVYEGETRQAVENVQETFPGAEVRQGPAPAPAPAPQPVPGPSPASSGPAPVPGAAESVEDHWLDLFENFDQWYDNRSDKPSAKHPDFKHKTKKTGDGKNIALWVDSKSTPAWVRQKLGVA